MFCGECGDELRDGARFCPRCGTAVDGEVGKKAPEGKIALTPIGDEKGRYGEPRFVDDRAGERKVLSVMALLVSLISMLPQLNVVLFGEVNVVDFVSVAGKLAKNGQSSLVVPAWIYAALCLCAVVAAVRLCCGIFRNGGYGRRGLHVFALDGLMCVCPIATEWLVNSTASSAISEGLNLGTSFGVSLCTATAWPWIGLVASVILYIFSSSTKVFEV